MTETEMINNLGTIAKSGTKIFKSTMDCDSMIDKFGIGFYSVYLVADKIVVTSKRYDDDLYEWESNSHQRYSIRCDRTNNSMEHQTGHLRGHNRDKLARLLKSRTSASGDEACSLQDYINRMKKNQRYIYFIAGENIKQVEDSVFIEALKMRDIEVIYMTDPIDEFMR
ncbi:heat shock protein 83-like [Temnothorax curvispinosus]|uniref:Heat shock protein 83-like n=1 Tax=Temnothorax curvispinosus TaxID=300111 RepID=A0A6J1QR67_9HYME|nr:heat shock protein 83-like [Temnothorax curvispinosus]